MWISKICRNDVFWRILVGNMKFPNRYLWFCDSKDRLFKSNDFPSCVIWLSLMEFIFKTRVLFLWAISYGALTHDKRKYRISTSFYIIQRHKLCRIMKSFMILSLNKSYYILKLEEFPVLLSRCLFDFWIF